MSVKRKKILVIALSLVVLLAGSFTFIGFGNRGGGKRPADSGVFHVVSQSADTLRLVSPEAAVKVNSVPELYKLLEQAGGLYGFENPHDELQYEKTLEAPFGYVHTLNQMYRGYPVFGRSVRVATDVTGNVLSITGNYLKRVAPVNKIAFSARQAAERVAAIAPGCRPLAAVIEIYSLGSGAPRYAQTVYTDAAQYFLDAETLEVLSVVSTAASETIPSEPYPTRQKDYDGNTVEVTLEKTVEAGADGPTYYLADCLRNIYLLDNAESYDYDGKPYENKTGVFDDKIAITAFLNLVKSFDFYTKPENIGVSLRGADGSVNLTHDDAETADELIVYAYMHYGKNYENAAYVSGLKEQNPRQAVFVFGDGNPSRLFDLAYSLDVVGHEYQHVVTSYSANLVYLNASGAINEGISDVFGALIEGHELTDDAFWQLGEDVTNPDYQYALRDMKDPLALGYPDRYNGAYFRDFCYLNHDHYNSSCDNGGVHTNSSVVTHAAYEMWRLQPALFTKEVMGTLWYSTLMLLPQDAEFSDLRVLMRQAALALGYSEEILSAISKAFDDVNVLGAEGEHTIRFDKGGAEGDAPAPITRLYGESFVIPAVSLTKPGYEFYGWSETGTTESKVYLPGVAYRMPANDITLRPIYSISAWNNASLKPWAGDGKYSTPYLIQSEEDLAALAYYINNWRTVQCPQVMRNKKFLMTRDLDLKNIPWIPIGLDNYINNLNALSITFDGGGHAVHNLKIDGNVYGADGLGLFGITNCTVENLTIASGSIRGAADYVGAIAGRIWGDIRNCASYAEVENTTEGYYPGNDCNLTGGLAGMSWSKITISFNHGSVTGTAVVGGIAGAVEDRIINCYNSGAVKGGVSAGGILGLFTIVFAGGAIVNGETIYSPGAALIGNCYNTGSVTGVNAGGIGGKTSDVYYANCINIGDIAGASPDAAIGGIVGFGTFRQVWRSGITSKSEGTMLLGCKSAGTIRAGTAAYAGGIAGRLFDGNPVGYVKCEKNIYKAQAGLVDIGNFDAFDAAMTERFHGERAKASESAAFEGEFDFDSDAYYENASLWSNTGWSVQYGIGYEWELPGKNQMPVLKEPEYWTDYRAEAFAGGDGSALNPYKIASAEQLALLAWAINFNNGRLGEEDIQYRNYQLTNDIDLSGKIWCGIGIGLGNDFGGKFDGNGKKIINMFARERVWYQDDYAVGFERYAVRINTGAAGLFGRAGTYGGITIQGVTVENCNLLGDKAAGILVNADYIDSVLNCVVKGGVVSGFSIAGGIVGELEVNPHNSIEIRGCYNDAEIVGALSAGGICGFTERASFEGTKRGFLTVSACVNRGNVTAFGKNEFTEQFASAAGGIVGTLTVGNYSIISCINDADIVNLDIPGSAAGIANVSKDAALNILRCVQSGDVQKRDGAYALAGSLASCTLISSVYGYQAEIVVENCYYVTDWDVVSHHSFGAGQFSVTQKNNHASKDAADYLYTDLAYFSNGRHLGNLNFQASNRMYANINGYQMIDLYIGDTYTQTLFAKAGEQTALPAVGTESTGYGAWTDQCGAIVASPFTVSGDTVLVFDSSKPNNYWGEWTVVKEATCEEAGQEKRVARANPQEAQYREIAALGHQSGRVWQYDSENHWKTCTICGEAMYKESHDFEWVIIESPTLTEKGLKQHICHECGTVLEEEVLPVNIGAWVGIAVSSCAAVGFSSFGVIWFVKRRRRLK